MNLNCAFPAEAAARRSFEAKGPPLREEQAKSGLLVELAAAGDPEARQALVRVLLPRIRRVVRRVGVGRHDVDDIVQDAALRILLDLKGYRGLGPLNAWVDRLVVRLTIARLRKLRSERDLLGVNGWDHCATCQVAERYVSGQVMRILDDLPESQRYAFVSHHVLGMTVPEIADEMGAPCETVRSRLRLARDGLRRAIGGF